MSAADVAQDGATATSPLSSSAEPTLSGIQPISVKKTLMLLNHFVVSTTEFLNKFSSLCEGKLQQVSQRVQRTEIVLNLLEAKLDSIGWMGGGGGATAAASATSTTAGVAPPAAPPMDGSVPAAPPTAPDAAAAAPAAPEPVASGPKLKDDPRYGKYFKMLNLGVPRPAIQLKMKAEGVDPTMIEKDPEEPAPPMDEETRNMMQNGGGGGGEGDGSDSEASEQMSDVDD